MYDWRADVRARLAGAGLHPQDEAEIVEEVAQHLEAQFAELAMTIGAEGARERLLAQLRDRGFDDAALGRKRRSNVEPRIWVRGSFLRDLRYGARSLRRSPGLVITGVLALALGVGLTTVMFSIIYGLLIKGLPFQAPERIAMIYRTDPTGRGQETLVPLADFVRYRADQHSFSSFGGYRQGRANVFGGDRPERLNVAELTDGAFEATGVRPLLGRTFTASDNETGAPLTAVISYATWRDRFALDSLVLGRVLRVNGRPHAIIGVMPEGYAFPGWQQLWVAAQLDTRGLRPGEGPAFTIVARLRPGVNFPQANAELSGMARRLAAEPTDSAALRDLAQPFVRATIPARVYALLYAMLGAVFLVLLIACANVANLLLDRAVSRTRDVGIRVALGASRLAVVRQALVESGILALAAAGVGTLLAQAGVMSFNRAIVALQADRPFWMDIRLHIPVLFFVLLVAVVASVVSGLLPALHAARLDINSILKDESHGASSFRAGNLSRAIVVFELALSSAMLLAAGFMTKSIARLGTLEPRFATDSVFTARVSQLSTDTIRQRRFLAAMEHDLTALPSVGAVYLGHGLPGGGWMGDRVAIEGHVYARELDYPMMRWLAVNPGFFTVFRVGILRGRAIRQSDRRGTQPVAVVSDEFVRQYFPGVEPIGQRIRLGVSSKDWLTIVGVIPTLYAAGIPSANGSHFPPEVLTSFWQGTDASTATVALRGPTAVANATSVRNVVAALDADAAVFEAARMSDVLNQPSWPLRVFGTLFVIFGVASLILAAIGLYAVMAFSVSRRLREMGIRLALGATGTAVVRMICVQGLKQIALGMALGLFLGTGLVRLLRMLLFEVQPSDPRVFGSVIVVLSASAFIACLLPAIRATRVDPLVALRAE